MERINAFLKANGEAIASFKNLISILAIIIAGLWVLFNYMSIKKRIDYAMDLEKTKRDQFDKAAIQVQLMAKQIYLDKSNLQVLVEVSITNKGDKNQTLYFPVEPLKLSKAEFSDTSSIPFFPKDKVEIIKYSRSDKGFDKMRDSLLCRRNVEWKFNYVIKVKEPGLYYARYRIPVADTISNFNQLKNSIVATIKTENDSAKYEYVESLPSFHGEIFFQVVD